MGQNRLSSLGIVCIERSYGNKVIVNSMDKITNIFGQRHGRPRKNFFFFINNFLILTRLSRLVNRGHKVCEV